MRTLKTKGDIEIHSGKALKRPSKPLAEETAEMVSELMNASTSFHKLHLSVTGTGSYAQHKALNDLYDSLPEHADILAEGFQGISEILLKYEDKPPRKLKTIKEGLDYLREMYEEVSELQSEMPYSEIVNNLDLVKDSINKAKYKLIFLS